jgi:hypothetical protein
MGYRYSGARGTLIYEKNLKPKILCQTTFNSFGAVGESAYFHSAPSPTALIFIARFLL